MSKVVEFGGEHSVYKIESNGLVNLTQMFKSFNQKHGTKRRIDKYMETESYQSIVSELERVIPAEGVSLIVKGNHADGRQQGTWVHEMVAMDAAAYLSVKVRMEIYNVFLKYHRGELKPTLSNWYVRADGKVERRRFTDVLKMVTKIESTWFYAEATNILVRFCHNGKNAKLVKERMGFCNKASLRDYYDDDSIKHVMLMEDLMWKSLKKAYLEKGEMLSESESLAIIKRELTAQLHHRNNLPIASEHRSRWSDEPTFYLITKEDLLKLVNKS